MTMESFKPLRVARVLLLLLVSVGCSVGAWAREAPIPLQRAPLGANLPPIHDWMYTPVYVDLVMQARRFGSPTAPWDESASLTAKGWPVGDFGVLLSTGLKGYVGSPGTYKLRFKGRANVDVVASKALVSQLKYDAVTDKSQADIIVFPDATQLALSFTQTGRGIRDLQVIRPGYSAEAPPLFTQDFLRHIGRFQVLRFMDWLRTNGHPVRHWAERSTPDNNHFASEMGVPWEHIIALANQTKQDIWINIPVAADDDYVRQLAHLLRLRLNPDVVIYLEYSNEIWNGSFGQNKTHAKLAKDAVNAKVSRLAHDGTRDENVIVSRHVAERLKVISDIFRAEQGDARMMRKIRPVLAGQVVQPYVTDVMLSYIAAVYGPPSQYFYGLAGAPYFNLGKQQTQDGLTTTEVLQAMAKSIDALSKSNALESNLAQARWYGLRFLAYEGGADTFGPGSIAAKKAASLDDRMADLCKHYLERWYALGGELFMWFQAGAGNWDTAYGTWELSDEFSQASTPKTRCLDQVLAQGLPKVEPRHSVPGRVSALDFVGNQSPYTKASVVRLRYLHPGQHLDYLIHVENAGTYQLTLQAAAAVPGNTVDVLVGGKAVAMQYPLLSAGWDTPVDNSPVTLSLSKGFHTVRIRTHDEPVMHGGFSLKALTFKSST